MRTILAAAFSVVFCLVFLAASLPSEVVAQAPRSMAFQGFLTDTLGTPIDGPKNLAFRLYDAAIGGTQVWVRFYSAVDVNNGSFDVVLEGGSPLFSSLTFGDSLWVQFAVGAQVLSPRTQLRAAPFAMGLSLPLTATADVSGSGNAALKVTNTAVGGLNYGVFGENTSSLGRGVYGLASAAAGATRGVYGHSFSSAGTGVYGVGAAHGVYGASSDSTGRGVYGFATANAGAAVGVYGESSSTNGQGVFGLSTATTGRWVAGVFGSTASDRGQGVWGWASDETGGTIGVYGQVESTSGTGVLGYAQATSGTTHGVFGVVDSGTGWAGKFKGGHGVYTFGSSNSGTDLVLGGKDASNTDGRISSDKDYVSSDVFIESNHSVYIQLDDDGSGGDADFQVRDKNGTAIFNVDDSGDVKVNGGLVHTSDRNRKDGIVPVDVSEILEEVASLPISRWHYKGQSAPHVGPMAQDFFASFGLGSDDTGIATVDGDGIALAAIQGLYELVKEQQAEIERMRAVMERAGLE